MASSLPILQFEPFIMENGEKLGIRNLGIRWKKNLTKFENFLIVMNINEDKKNCNVVTSWRRLYTRY